MGTNNESETNDEALDNPFCLFENQEEADNFFDLAWNEANAAEQEAIVRSYFQITTRLVRGLKNGGAAGRMIQIPPMHAKLVAFLAAVDSIHDFGEIAYTYFPSKIFPNGLGPLDVKKEGEFLRRLCKMRNLTWDDGTTLTNPVYRCNFLDAPCTFPPGARTVKELFEHQQKQYCGKNGSNAFFLPVDIWAFYHSAKKKEVIQLQQFAQCIGVMRKRYGSRTIVVDASGNEIHKVVLGFKYISRTFLEKFILKPDPLTVANLRTKLQKYIAKLDPDLDLIEWKIETIDANLWDAADNGGDFPVNKRDATGPIFPTSLGPQILLKGINKEKCVRAEIMEPGKSPWKVCLSNNETTRNFSIGHLEFILKIQDSLSSTHKLSEIEKKLITLSPETIFALKRSGDWGQVQYWACFGHQTSLQRCMPAHAASHLCGRDPINTI